MKDAHARARENKRQTGECPDDAEKVPTYQELLDEALDETFPASDPISPTAAMHASHRVESARDPVDWALRPGGGQAVPPPSEPCEGLLTAEVVQEALERMRPMLNAAIADPEVCGTGALALVALLPGVATHSPSEPQVLLEQGFGNRDAWDADYMGFARAKARLTCRLGMDSRQAQVRPHLLRSGDTLLAGGVNLDGIVVGVSGAQPWYDEAFAMGFAAMLRALSMRSHARLLAGGACEVPRQSEPGPTR